MIAEKYGMGTLEGFYNEKMPMADTIEARDAKEILDSWRYERLHEDGFVADIVGVLHSPEATKLYASQLEKIISGSNVVLVESGPLSRQRMSESPESFIEKNAPTADGLLKIRRILDRFQRQFKVIPADVHLDEISDEEITRVYLMHLTEEISFFSKLEVIAATHSVPIAYSDPLEGLRHYYDQLPDGQKNISQLNERLQNLDQISFMTGAIGATIATLAKTGEDRLTRRQFLAGAAAGVGGVVSGLAGFTLTEFVRLRRKIENELLQEMIETGDKNAYIDKANRTGEPYGFFTHSTYGDYRDAVGGLGTRRLGEEFGQVATIWGAGHFQGLKHYVKNPTEATYRTKLFYPDNISYDPPTLFVYDYDSESKTWTQRSRTSLFE